MANSSATRAGSKSGRGTRSRSGRRSPGSSGQGNYYHIELRPDEDFVTFRTQDVGDPGHIQRVAGKRESGSWTTVKWLIGKEDAHLEGDTLVGDTKDAKGILKKLGSRVVHKSGDRFEATTLSRSAGTKRAGSSSARKSQVSRSKSR